ncbi:MAG: alpha/beta hydrolase [Myxococcota bacterium]|nr:alpha/beta hydrolase [Myxococcota bacterium]
MARIPSEDGIALYAEAAGEGPTVVFSCALNTTHENWRRQSEALAALGYRAVLWDYRGHGLSDAPEAPDAYTMARVVADLGTVVDWAAPGERVVLAGLSFGGLASLHFVLGQPHRVRALVLAGTGPGFKNPEAQARWAESVGHTARFIERKGAAVFAERATEMTVGRDVALPEARRAQAAIAKQTPHGLAHFGRQIAGLAPPVIDRLGEIEAPALVVRGEEDAAYARAAEVMASRMPRAETLAIPGAGHIVNIEAADAFDAALLAFLEKLPAEEA